LLRLFRDYPDSLQILLADRSIIREAYPAYPPQVCSSSSLKYIRDTSVIRSVTRNASLNFYIEIVVAEVN